MTPLYALTGSPGAKAQPGFAGRGHSIAKRRRGPAGEPVHPDSAFHAFPAWLSWSPQSRGGNRAGWERLTDEGRRLWPVRCFPTPLLHQWTQESLQRTQLLSHYR